MSILCGKYTLVSPRPALFLDRDGIIIKDKGYVNSKEETEFLHASIELIRLARSYGFLIFIVTNQAGVARHYFTEEDLISYNLWLMSELAKLNSDVDELVYCPSHPIYGEKRECACRKPNNGMLRYLIKKWNIDLENSLMVGDKDTDVDAGKSLGIQSFKWNPENIHDRHISDLILKPKSFVPRKVEVLQNG